MRTVKDYPVRVEEKDDRDEAVIATNFKSNSTQIVLMTIKKANTELQKTLSASMYLKFLYFV